MKKSILTWICSTVALLSYSQTAISNLQAIESLHKDSTIQLLDVRTSAEFEDKHIKNALNIDWKNQEVFVKQLDQIDKNKPVYIYCLSGGRSKQAAAKLNELGYKVYDIQGGIVKWEADKLPIVATNKSEKEELTIEQYQDLVKSHHTVLIDFYAPWCPPCQALSHIIDSISTKYKEKVRVVKINIDQNNKLYNSLNITGIPMLFIYKNGIVTWSINGLTDQKTIESHL